MALMWAKQGMDLANLLDESEDKAVDFMSKQIYIEDPVLS